MISGRHKEKDFARETERTFAARKLRKTLEARLGRGLSAQDKSEILSTKSETISNPKLKCSKPCLSDLCFQFAFLEFWFFEFVWDLRFSAQNIVISHFLCVVVMVLVI